jgi:hypothetical protein
LGEKEKKNKKKNKTKLHTRQANMLPLEPMKEAKENHVMCPLPLFKPIHKSIH